MEGRKSITLFNQPSVLTIRDELSPGSLEGVQEDISVFQSHTECPKLGLRTLPTQASETRGRHENRHTTGCPGEIYHGGNKAAQDPSGRDISSLQRSFPANRDHTPRWCEERPLGVHHTTRGPKPEASPASGLQSQGSEEIFLRKKCALGVMPQGDKPTRYDHTRMITCFHCAGSKLAARALPLTAAQG